MKKNLLKTLVCLFVVAAVVPDYTSYAQGTKGLTRSIIINNGDTTVNGKKFSELDKIEKAKLREEFKEMEKNFRGGNIVIRKGGTQDIVISRNGEKPNILHWNDDLGSTGANGRSFNFDKKGTGDFKVFKHNGDSMLFNKDFQVFSFGGDSSMNFKFNTDSLMKRFEIFGVDSNLRKRVITMHRDLAPGGPGGMILRGNPSTRVFERGNLESFGNRNNSSSFNYNYTDKDGISNHMSIRISDASKDQLKKITGAEAITKSLEVSDLTLFPNFSNGKMTLSFNVPAKGTTRVSILDSDMKSIFTDEAANLSGHYVKQLSLPKNGVYYVSVNQSGNWFVKRIVKE